MAILNTDLKLYHSGGGANSNIALDIGGDISSVELTDNTLNNLWPDVTGDQGAAGMTSYRKIFFKNAHATLSGTTTVMWILSNTTSSSDAVTIGLDLAGVNAVGDDIASETDAPSPAVTFVAAVNKAGGLALGTVPATQKYAIWIKRVVDASATAADANTYQLKCECDTAA